jgi:protein phosphatase
MKYLTFTHRGLRENNEDSCAAVRFKPLSVPLKPRRPSQDQDEYVDVLLLSDGMGGLEHGEEISAETIRIAQTRLFCKLNNRAILQEEKPEDRCVDVDALMPDLMDRVVATTNEHIRDLIDDREWEQAGATVVACLVQENTFWYTHRGDSRLYHWDAEEKILSQLTKDHTVPQILHDNQMIDSEAARHHARRNELVFYVGANDQPDLQTKSRRLGIGDRLLLCSDGISGTLSNSALEEVLAENDLFDVAHGLLHGALDAGSSDNMSMVLYEYDGSPRCVRIDPGSSGAEDLGLAQEDASGK